MERIRAALILVLAGAFLASCGGGGKEAKAVAEEFWNAAKSGDNDAAKSYVAKASKANLRIEDQGDFWKRAFTLGNVEVNGNTAKVATLKGSGSDSMKLQTVLIKEDGAWKVNVLHTMTTFVVDRSESMQNSGQLALAKREAEAIIFVVDRSGSMKVGGKLALAKREVLRRLSGFSSSTEFGVVFVDSSIMAFPADASPLSPVSATEGNKEAASAFVNYAVPDGAGSCPQQGFIVALGFADRSNAARKAIVYIGDGGGACMGGNEDQNLAQTLEVVTQRNQSSAQIHCIGVLMEGQELGEQFLKDLAAKNGGTYRELIR